MINMMLLILLSVFSCAVNGVRSEREVCSPSFNINVKHASTEILGIAVETCDFRILIDLADGPRETNLQKENDLNSLSVLNLRKTAKASLYMMIAICKEASFNCKLCDLYFIATELAQGDPRCFLSCSASQVGGSFRKLPTDKTLETFIEVGKALKTQANTDSKKRALITKGTEFAGHGKKHKKRAIFLAPVIFAAVGAIINVCSAAAIGWAASNAQESGSSLGTAVDVAGPVIDVARANGCFMASSHVNVQLQDLQIVAKPLSDVKVGDMVESLDERTGKVMFTPVYYMAHNLEKTSSPLLSIYYKNENQGTSSLGLSERHLVYATKVNNSISESPFNDPIQAKDLNIGDHVWVMNEEKELKPQPIIDIVPFHSEVRHPLTENHHIIVDGVHASVHVLNEPLYRMMTSPLRFLYHINPEWNKSGFVERMVKFVESVKEPIFNEVLVKSISSWNIHDTISM